MKKTYLPILILMLLASCGSNTSIKETETEEEETAVEPVLTEEQIQTVGITLGNVEQRALNNVIRVNGEMALDAQKRGEVTSLMAGIIRQVTVYEGDQVKAGQTVAWLENTDIVALQRDYLMARQQLTSAEQELIRQQTLASAGAGIDKNLQQSMTSQATAKAQAETLSLQLQQLSISPKLVEEGQLVTQIPIKAPITGTVGTITVSTGSYVDQQTSLMNIADNAAIHCDVRVFEKDIPYVVVGQDVDLQLTNQPDVILKGRVATINKSFDRSTKSIVVHVDIVSQHQVKLIPGMYATGLISVGRQTVTALPSEAIVSSEGKKYIFVMTRNDNGNRHFRREEVLTGVSELGYTQITPVHPLSPSATVVTQGAFYLGSMTGDHGEE